MASSNLIAFKVTAAKTDSLIVVSELLSFSQSGVSEEDPVAAHHGPMLQATPLTVCLMLCRGHS